jgi:hypothetical protein
MILIPKNWSEFQHYRNRRPPWIKLHRGLLENYEYAILPIEAKAIAPLLWLIASEHEDGVIDLSLEALAFRLRVDSATVGTAISGLVAHGFFLLHEDASAMLAECYHPASAEGEGETEGEKEKRPHPRGARTKGMYKPKRGAP